MMVEWIEFGAAFAAFMLSHIVPARTGLRTALITRFGKKPYLITYSIVSIALLVWLVGAAGRAPYIPVWDFAPWQTHVPHLLMPIAVMLGVFAATSPNPLSFGRASEFNPQRPGVAGVARHPILWAATIWSIAHMVPNGDVAHLILFGIFALFAILGMPIVDRRKQRKLGAAKWARLSINTSNVPLAPLFGGRWHPHPTRFDLFKCVAAIGLYVVLLLLHGPIIGPDVVGN